MSSACTRSRVTRQVEARRRRRPLGTGRRPVCREQPRREQQRPQLQRRLHGVGGVSADACEKHCVEAAPSPARRRGSAARRRWRAASRAPRRGAARASPRHELETSAAAAARWGSGRSASGPGAPCSVVQAGERDGHGHAGAEQGHEVRRVTAADYRNAAAAGRTQRHQQEVEVIQAVPVSSAWPAPVHGRSAGRPPGDHEEDRRPGQVRQADQGHPAAQLAGVAGALGRADQHDRHEHEERRPGVVQQHQRRVPADVERRHRRGDRVHGDHRAERDHPNRSISRTRPRPGAERVAVRAVAVTGRHWPACLGSGRPAGSGRGGWVPAGRAWVPAGRPGRGRVGRVGLAISATRRAAPCRCRRSAAARRRSARPAGGRAAVPAGTAVPAAVPTARPGRGRCRRPCGRRPRTRRDLAEHRVRSPDHDRVRTPGSSRSTSSISRGRIFSPLRLISSLDRPTSQQVAVGVQPAEVAGVEPAVGVEPVRADAGRYR